jgi:hypothetical protein
MDYEFYRYYISAMGPVVLCREGGCRDISPSEGPAAKSGMERPVLKMR